MGEEKLDNTVYSIRGLYDLADMAAAKGDTRDELGARRADEAARALRRSGGCADQPVRGLARRHQRQAPAEALDRGDADGGRADGRRQAVPGLAPADTAWRRWPSARRLLQRRAAVQPRPLPHGLRRRPKGKGERMIFSLNTAIGRRRGQLRPLGEAPLHRRQREPMFQPDEQPGAMPEICALDRDRTRNIDRCWRAARWWCRPGATTARRGRSSTSSSACGRPGPGRLDVVPQVPDGWRRSRAATSASARVRDVAATARSTTVSVRTRLRELRIGLTLKSPPGRVRLDGRTVRKPDVRRTNRGYEVTVKAPPNGRHTLELAG